MVSETELGRLAGNAMAQAMYSYTFGLISDLNGHEGRGIGTGVGLVWQGRFLIATAKHVIADTPPQRLYYLLPQDKLVIPDSQASVDWRKVALVTRRILENPCVVRPDCADTDLAAVLVPEQPAPTASKHFFRLEASHATPPVCTSVGFLGYPSAVARPVGLNYAAMPSHGFGKICLPTCSYDLQSEFAVEYVAGDELDAHGFSGSGAWYSRSAGSVWSPEISLGGLVTNYYRRSQVLICCRVETLISFLSAKL